MKITKLLLILSFFASISLNAQEVSNHALGLRLGESDGFGAEISYQKSIGRYNRAEFNLGWRDSREFDAVKFSGLLHWMREISRDFNWYYGFGGGLGNANFEPTLRNNVSFQPEGGLFVFAAGTIGVEYNFDFPLLISLDIRPEVGLLGYGDFDNIFEFDVALGLRYQF